MDGQAADETAVIRRAVYLLRMLGSDSGSAEVLHRRQMQRMNSLVRHAVARVPFYRKLYEAHGIDAASFNADRDLQRLPVVTKHVLRAAGAEALAEDAPIRRVTIRTSGSTGEPFAFPIDHRHDQWRKAQYLRPYVKAGRRLADGVLRLTALPQARMPWFSRFGLLREWQFACDSPPKVIFEAWKALTPRILQGYPSSLRSLAHHCLEQNTPLSPAPKLVFSDSELLLPDTRALLEKVFAAPVIDIFGTFETDNIAYQCPARDGYHVANDSVILEILRDGLPVPPGEEGEIVVTVLGNYVSPFIRYNLGDVARLMVEPCTCGYPFPRLTGIRGRADDVITLLNGRKLTAQGLLGRLDRFAEVIRHYQLRQTDVLQFELLLVPAREFAESHAQSIRQILQPALGAAHLELRCVETIPTERSGKRRAFVSLVAGGAHA